MHGKVLAKRVRELKDTENGVDHMCKEMDKIYNEGMEIGEKNGIEKGIKKGELKAKKETVFSLVDMGMSLEQIAEAVKLDIEVVREWMEEK